MPNAAAAHSVSLSSTGCGAWSVADAVDGAVGEAVAQRRDVRLGAQRRVHLVHRVVAGRELVGEEQVVRRDLGGDRASPWTWPSG